MRDATGAHRDALGGALAGALGGALAGRRVSPAARSPGGSLGRRRVRPTARSGGAQGVPREASSRVLSPRTHPHSRASETWGRQRFSARRMPTQGVGGRPRRPPTGDGRNAHGCHPRCSWCARGERAVVPGVGAQGARARCATSAAPSADRTGLLLPMVFAGRHRLVTCTSARHHHIG